MNFSSHAKAGLAVAGLTGLAQLFIKYDIRLAAIAATLAFVGSIFPDLDTDSIPSRWAARVGVVLTCVCIYTGNYLPAVIGGGLFFVIKSGKHRGFTHKYFLAVLCVVVGLYHGNFLYSAFGVGLFCHYVVDGLSPLDPRNWI